MWSQVRRGISGVSGWAWAQIGYPGVLWPPICGQRDSCVIEHVIPYRGSPLDYVVVVLYVVLLLLLLLIIIEGLVVDYNNIQGQLLEPVVKQSELLSNSW